MTSLRSIARLFPWVELRVAFGDAMDIGEESQHLPRAGGVLSASFEVPRSEPPCHEDWHGNRAGTPVKPIPASQTLAGLPVPRSSKVHAAEVLIFTCVCNGCFDEDKANNGKAATNGNGHAPNGAQPRSPSVLFLPTWQ